MTQKKGAAEATPLKDKSKSTKFNQHIIDILIYIFFFELGFCIGIIVKGLAL